MKKSNCHEKKDKATAKGAAWTKQEDDKLVNYIKIHGEGHWSTLPQAAGLQRRCGKSCRLRWMKHLRPDIKRANFCPAEDDLIIKLHALLGNRWSLIAGRLPGRTDNQVKNYWDSHLKRKLIKMGIDPNNHRVHQTLTMSSSNNINDHLSADIDDTKFSHHSGKTISKNLSDDDGASGTATCSSHNRDDDDDDGDDDAVSNSSDHGLNLDLTIAFPSSSSYLFEKKI